MNKPGASWRVLAWNRGEKIEMSSKEKPSVFDELAIDNWFHLEQMDTRVWWMAAYEKNGGRHVLWVRIGRNGAPSVTYTHEVPSLTTAKVAERGEVK